MTHVMERKKKCKQEEEEKEEVNGMEKGKTTEKKRKRVKTGK